MGEHIHAAESTSDTGAAGRVDVADLDAAETCAAVERNHTALLATEAAELALVVHWADLHGPDSVQPSAGAGRVLPGTERVKRLGGLGTPEVAEFASAELGVLLQVSARTATVRIRDALDLRHRHPRLWEAVQSLGVRAWVAKKITMATTAAGLTLEQARWVDEQITPAARRKTWGQLEASLTAKILAADPVAAEARRLAAARDQCVHAGQCNEFGLKTLVVKAEAPAVIVFMAMVEQIGTLLFLEGDTRPVQLRRSAAVALLGCPHRAQTLLEKYAAGSTPATGLPPDPDGQPGQPDPHDRSEDDEVIGEGDVHPADNDADDPPTPTSPCPVCCGVGALPLGPDGRPRGTTALSAFMSPRLDLDKLRNRAVLYVHVSASTFARGTHGVARLEGVGPITVEQAREFLTGCQVKVVPVLDLAGQQPVDGYELPATMAEALHLRNPASVYPWSGSVSRRMDRDHTNPYSRPPDGSESAALGQTHLGNLGKLLRSEHRIKTFARGWQVYQPRPGLFYWRTRHGYWTRVDHTGSTYLGTVLPLADELMVLRAMRARWPVTTAREPRSGGRPAGR